MVIFGNTALTIKKLVCLILLCNASFCYVDAAQESKKYLCLLNNDCPISPEQNNQIYTHNRYNRDNQAYESSSDEDEDTLFLEKYITSKNVYILAFITTALAYFMPSHR